MNSPHKGQWRRAMIFSLICAWTSDWVNSRDAGDLRRLCALLWRHCNGYANTHHIENAFTLNSCPCCKHVNLFSGFQTRQLHSHHYPVSSTDKTITLTIFCNTHASYPVNKSHFTNAALDYFETVHSLTINGTVCRLHKNLWVKSDFSRFDEIARI